MSAHALPPGSLLTAFGVTAALAWTAAGRRRGPLAVATGLAAVQGVLHLIFGAGGRVGERVGDQAGPPGAGIPSDVLADLYPTHAAHAADAAYAGHMAHGMALGGGADGAGSGAGMLAVHLLAALVCGLWLARGEAALFAIARTVGARAAAPLRLLLAAAGVLVPAPPSRRSVRPRPYHRRPHGVVLAHSVSRRGPPRPAVPRATAPGVRIA
ncbi:hypothetical protein ABZ135_31665 [Streptomyces sp. NPDC006339]|uniref:hypothetical protein n=1 Tax=Streptomyces sp. NPDC006339 TaxID=3156755 RepID=UPI00339F1A0B